MKYVSAWLTAVAHSRSLPVERGGAVVLAHVFAGLVLICCKCMAGCFSRLPAS